LVNNEEEHRAGYGLFWPGRGSAGGPAEKPPEFLLTGPDGSILNPASPGDLLIEGDNLEALRILAGIMPGQVDFIYIDPPYNTGKNMAYRDNFSTCRRANSQVHPGALRHGAWLSMMFPLLVLARRLLSPGGVMYISIDDRELPGLILIADEIFGEENRAGIITWVKKKKGSHLSRALRGMTEYVLVYGRDIKKLDLYGEDAYSHKWQPLIKRVNREHVLTFGAGVVETTLPGSFYPRGTYGNGGTGVELLGDIHIKEGRIRNSFSIKARTVWTQKKLDREILLGTRVSIRSEKMGPSVFRHDQHKKKKSPPTLLDHNAGIGTNEDAWQEFREILGGAEPVFFYPKPLSLIRYLVNTISRGSSGGIFLDFFAGTGTTGQAVWQANLADGGDRRFILVQNKEPINPPVSLPGGDKITDMARLCRERLQKAPESKPFALGRLIKNPGMETQKPDTTPCMVSSKGYPGNSLNE